MIFLHCHQVLIMMMGSLTDIPAAGMELLLLANCWDISVLVLHQLLRITPDPFLSYFYCQNSSLLSTLLEQVVFLSVNDISG